jgi:chromosome segregation ATPase
MKAARPVIALLVLVALACLGWALWLRKQNAVLVLQSGTEEMTELQVRQRVVTLESENLDLRRRLESAGIEAPTVDTAPAAGARADEAARLEAVRALAELQKRFDAAQAQVQSLQSARLELESSLESAATDRKRLTAAEAELRENLASGRRVIEAMEAEIKTKTDRVVSLESDLRRARDANAAETRRNSQIAAILSSFDDVNRRRENTLTSLQRRFRDLTDAYRALALRLDTQRDSQTPVQITSGEVSRMTNTVQSAEDDLRQLNTLNAEAQRLTRRLQQ